MNHRLFKFKSNLMINAIKKQLDNEEFDEPNDAMSNVNESLACKSSTQHNLRIRFNQLIVFSN